ncbi:hypothetical protein PICST_28250 [Scheffersomyces stipitis CBS 6054]|uniref:Uncharacterized protein n=1 Tax=Scheffersomyces stipitis (strain ATCC 58785 / CBS 6054 / NBRC 10063 / NRRL Y-11545) TaxID=322104 RepID=A3GFH7_PICST|nr:predicted protein [Scheffersomyces stipitis CBS 6054]EAZ63760.2 hypothetical protein PICST_28250 [Scheffersomyces stipitis CBS 6054]KAG2731491.1 hypothetical protein G9P44_005078 [Scheffersomyces stipitis]
MSGGSYKATENNDITPGSPSDISQLHSVTFGDESFAPISTTNTKSNGKFNINSNSIKQTGSSDNSLDLDHSVNIFAPTSEHRQVFSRFPDLNRQNSVILASSGKKVHRTLSLSSDTFRAEIDNQRNETDALLGNRNNSLAEDEGRTASLYRTLVLPFAAYYYDNTCRSVLKCAIAYLIASLGVYWTPFDNLLGTTDSKHVVATVATYFHPSRSKGSMTQSLVYVIISLAFTFVVSFGCRAVSAEFYNRGENELGHAIDLVVSSVALGIIAFSKQMVNKPTFNTACSLASISIVACIVKEGSLNSDNIPIERLQATFQVVVVGCIISVAVCYLLWPVSSIKKLRKSLNDSYNIMSSGLSVVAKRFLTGEKLTTRDSEIFNKLKSNISELLSNLEEAKFELRLYGREEEWKLFEQLVNSTISLGRQLQALRSSAEMQWSLLHSEEEGSEETSTRPESIKSMDSYTSDILRLTYSVENMTTILDEHFHTAHNSTQLFNLFVSYLSPSIRSFIFTIKGVMSEVPFEKFSEIYPNKFAKTTNLQHSLNDAIYLFENKQAESIEKLYDQDIFKREADFLFKADKEEVAACCGNFSSLLNLFANELLEFIKLSEKYEDAREAPLAWPWLHVWEWKWNDRKDGIYRQNSTLNAALLDLRAQLGTQAKPKDSETGFQKWSYKVWMFFKFLRRTDIQFGIRVGLGAFVISLFAFLPQTKETFNMWRGEWALAIYCIMMNKSLGGTTMTVKWRILGTFMGAFGAYVVWMLTDGNVYILCLSGFLIAIPSFYIIIFWAKNNAFGRFILLAYNLTALYSYSMRSQLDNEDGNEGGEDPIVDEIAFHRFVAVSIGIVWALIMASCVLPSSARSRLKNGLTVLWLRLGLIWNSDPLEYDPKSMRLVGLKDESGMNRLLSECETLLKQAPIEFRLKGTFPTKTYASLLQHTSAIIDSFENINLMIKVDPVLNANEEFVLKYIEAERNEVGHRIFLIFYMIASSMKLGFPLPSKPASIEHAKDRLLYKLSEVRNQALQKPELQLTNNDFILLYSYILVASSITEQLDNIMEHVKQLLGNVSEDIFSLV